MLNLLSDNGYIDNILALKNSLLAVPVDCFVGELKR